MKEEKGTSLIALILIVFVLIILAAISVTLVITHQGNETPKNTDYPVSNLVIEDDNLIIDELPEDNGEEINEESETELDSVEETVESEETVEE